MRRAVWTGILLFVIAALITTGGCSRTTGPESEDSYSSPAWEQIDAGSASVEIRSGVGRLSIATVQMNMISETTNSVTIDAVLEKLTADQRNRVASRRYVLVVDPADVLTILGLFGIVSPDPATIEDGILAAVYTPATWGQIKCCMKDPKCCPKKKKKDQVM